MTRPIDRCWIACLLLLVGGVGIAFLPAPSAAEEPALLAQVTEPSKRDSEVTSTANRSAGEAARSAGQHAAGSQEVIVYKPPRRGAPRVNVGAGGVRGSQAVPQPLVLAPDHVGDTSSAAPSLFYHIDGVPGADVDVIFTLIDDTSDAPLVEVKLPRPERPGIHRVRLSRYGVELRPDVEYEWSIALVRADSSQQQLAVSVGYLRRVGGAAPAGRSGAAFAEAGIWYDALAALSDAVAARPDDSDARAQRDSLLRQASLEAAVK
jgi:hypothetical protein